MQEDVNTTVVTVDLVEYLKKSVFFSFFAFCRSLDTQIGACLPHPRLPIVSEGFKSGFIRQTPTMGEIEWKATCATRVPSMAKGKSRKLSSKMIERLNSGSAIRCISCLYQPSTDTSEGSCVTFSTSALLTGGV